MTLAKIFVVVVVGGGTALALAVREAREAARQSQCRGHLSQIAIALHNYAEVHGTLPPAYVADADGKPMHSWRVLILPYMNDERELHAAYRFDEPWDGPNNRRLWSKCPSTYQCPSRLGRRTETDYLLVTGPETAFVGAESLPLDEIDDPDSTILLVEQKASDVVWCEPRDIARESIRELTSAHNVGTHILTVSGRYRTVGPKLSPELRRRFRVRQKE